MLFTGYTLLLSANALSMADYIECHARTHIVPITKSEDYAILGNSLTELVSYTLPALLQFTDNSFTKPHRIPYAEALLISILNIIDLDEDIDRRKRTKTDLQTRLFWNLFNDAVTDHRYPLDLKYSGILVRLCNRGLVRNIR